MTISVRERADTLGTLRHTTVHAMETLARWVPTTPDLEAKIVLGRHLWDLAQQADALGRRTHELRAALHYSPSPRPAYTEALELLRSTEGASERLAAFYDVFLPDLERRYRDYLAATDPMLDEPSVRVIERILTDLTRMAAESRQTRAERPDMTGSGDPTAERLRERLAAAAEYVQFRKPAGSVAESLA